MMQLCRGKWIVCDGECTRCDNYHPFVPRLSAEREIGGKYDGKRNDSGIHNTGADLPDRT